MFLVLLALTPLVSLEVDRFFLEELQGTKIEFDNYNGPYQFYNTVDEIRNIGAYLAGEITPTIKSEGNYSDKYRLFHRPKLEWEKQQLSCDVFEITEESLIDNIENIELIISEYLIMNYGYSSDDGDLLAHLILIYNAVFRADTSHFQGNYTSEGVVPGDIKNIGIDLHFYNWPGKTFIYIPLSDNLISGKLTNIDSDILIDDKVIENIKLEDENNIEFREEIIDFKEREFDEIIQDVEKQKEDLIILKKSSDSENIDSNMIDEKIKDKESEIEETISDLEKKDEKILDLRDTLAEDKNELITNIKKSTTGAGFKYILNRQDGDTYFGQLINLSSDGVKLNKSDVNTIRNNSFNKKGDRIFIIAGGDKSNQLVTLGKLKSETLTLDSWAEIQCYENSPIVIQGNYVYVIIYLDGRYYLGEFDRDLKLIRRSAVSLFKDSFIVLKSNIFYIQGVNNNIKLVNLSDFITVL
jgi:hypothetical protein